MGNAIKNYERKRRKERKEAYKEVNKIVRDILIEHFNYPEELKEKINK